MLCYIFQMLNLRMFHWMWWPINGKMVIFQIMITCCILTSTYVLGTMHMCLHFVGKFMCVIIYNLHIPQNIHLSWCNLCIYHNCISDQRNAWVYISNIYYGDIIHQRYRPGVYLCLHLTTGWYVRIYILTPVFVIPNNENIPCGSIVTYRATTFPSYTMT